jgi:hypothetical protein
MRKKDFKALALELSERLSRTTHEFFAEKGLTFDEKAYWAQSSIDRETIAHEIIFFGADRFPMRPDDDEAPNEPHAQH